jgi:predicted dehydrogenase
MHAGSSRRGRVVAVDPRRQTAVAGVEMYETLEEGWASVHAPAEAVCHVSVPLRLHHEIVLRLIDFGARRIIVEKPLAESAARAAEMLAVASAAGAEIVPMAVWPHSATTAQLAVRIGSAAPERIRFVQAKPRHRRTAWDRGHTSALQIEMPHQVLLAMFLAGPVRTLRSVELWDLETGAQRYSRSGGARVVLEHEGGTTSELVSDLSAPQRTRRLEVCVDGLELIACLPTSAAASTGVLCASDGTVLWRGDDRPLTRFVQAAYDRFIHGSEAAISPLTHLDVMATLDAAALRAVDDDASACAVVE